MTDQVSEAAVDRGVVTADELDSLKSFIERGEDITEVITDVFSSKTKLFCIIRVFGKVLNSTTEKALANSTRATNPSGENSDIVFTVAAPAIEYSPKCFWNSSRIEAFVSFRTYNVYFSIANYFIIAYSLPLPYTPSKLVC